MVSTFAAASFHFVGNWLVQNPYFWEENVNLIAQ